MATNDKKTWWSFVQTELVYTVLCCAIARLVVGNDLAAKDFGSWQPSIIKGIDTTAVICFILGARKSLTMFRNFKKGNEDAFNPDKYDESGNSTIK